MSVQLSWVRRSPERTVTSHRARHAVARAGSGRLKAVGLGVLAVLLMTALVSSLCALLTWALVRGVLALVE